MPDAAIDIFMKRGDLAHLALLMWAMSASALLIFALKEIAEANRRFESFITELARINKLFGEP